MNKIKTLSLALTFILFNICSLSGQVPENAKDISPLLIGEKLPSVSLLSPTGESVDLNTEIQKKNTVLVFYRGGWCPFCNRQLSGLAVSEEKIIDLGYQIIAVSPDDYRNLQPTLEKDDVGYKVYSDPEGKFIENMGIGFATSPKSVESISKRTIGKVTEVLPVPSVFVLNTEGEILFEYISPNYRKRISPELLLAVLENLD